MIGSLMEFSQFINVETQRHHFHRSCLYMYKPAVTIRVSVKRAQSDGENGSNTFTMFSQSDLFCLIQQIDPRPA